MSEVAPPVQTGASPGDSSLDEEPIFQAPNVLRIMWADPQHMAEQLVVWSLAHFGPRAEKSVEKTKREHPDAGREQLEDLVIRSQARVAATEGAFVGGPFIVLMPVAFCAALLAQAQMVYELAAVSGRDPRDAMRAADLLVLLGAHDSIADAQAAIAGMKKNPGQEGKKLPAGARVDMVKRMAYLLGLFTPDPGYSRFRFIIGWVGIGLLLLVGFVLPLVWVPYLAFSTRRSTLRLAARAREYYEAAGRPTPGSSSAGGWDSREPRRQHRARPDVHLACPTYWRRAHCAADRYLTGRRQVAGRRRDLHRGLLHRQLPLARVPLAAPDGAPARPAAPPGKYASRLKREGHGRLREVAGEPLRHERPPHPRVDAGSADDRLAVSLLERARTDRR